MRGDACAEFRLSSYHLAQPSSFRTWYGNSRDFDGVFEWTPRASRPKMGITPLSLNRRANFGVWADQETVYVVNDNNGRLFTFEKLAKGETWVTQEALASTGIDNPSIDLAAGTDHRALASVKVTDVMVLEITNWPVGIRRSPAGVGGLEIRAALFSFGFLLRRAAADYLDIHEQEIRVGLRVLPSVGGEIIGQVFISDSLENGAGYASLLGQPQESDRLLQYVLGQPPQAPTFYSFLVGAQHAGLGANACRRRARIAFVILVTCLPRYPRLEVGSGYRSPRAGPGRATRLHSVLLAGARRCGRWSVFLGHARVAADDGRWTSGGAMRQCCGDHYPSFVGLRP